MSEYLKVLCPETYPEGLRSFVCVVLLSAYQCEIFPFAYWDAPKIRKYIHEKALEMHNRGIECEVRFKAPVKMFAPG